MIFHDETVYIIKHWDYAKAERPVCPVNLVVYGDELKYLLEMADRIISEQMAELEKLRPGQSNPSDGDE